MIGDETHIEDEPESVRCETQTVREDDEDINEDVTVGADIREENEVD